MHHDDFELVAVLHGRAGHDVTRRAAGRPQPLVHNATGHHECAVQEHTVVAKRASDGMLFTTTSIKPSTM